MIALARHLPRLAARIPWAPLGAWPTPIRAFVVDGRTIWAKDEGASNARYGGNKIRTLEAWFGHARERGAQRIWAIGAYGSNHAIATVLHAPTAGLDSGVLLFPQPGSEWAIENCGALIASGTPIVRVRTVLEMPFAAMRIARRDPRSIVMPPGGATPIGTIGAMSAAFELADQLAAGDAPPPARIVVPVGSTCTIAGLTAGLLVAHAAGVWRWPLPHVHAVRVTPWPVTSALRIAYLVRRTLDRIASLGGPDLRAPLRELLARFSIDGHELGRGYGRATPRATAALASLTGAPYPRLDGVYSAKAAAALLRLHRDGVAPLLFWSTKSHALLDAPSASALRTAPHPLVTWLKGSGTTT